MDDVPIRDESIRLGQFLKLANLIDTGSDAKELMVQGLVTVNGEVETVAAASWWSATWWRSAGSRRACVAERYD